MTVYDSYPSPGPNLIGDAVVTGTGRKSVGTSRPLERCQILVVLSSLPEAEIH